MRFVVADLWGDVATPSASVSYIYAAPSAPEDDRDKIGFTIDVAQRLDFMTIASGTASSAATSFMHSPRENLADSA